MQTGDVIRDNYDTNNKIEEDNAITKNMAPEYNKNNHFKSTSDQDDNKEHNQARSLYNRGA